MRGGELNEKLKRENKKATLNHCMRLLSRGMADGLVRRVIRVDKAKLSL